MKNIPIVEGPLSELERIRPALLDGVVQRALGDLSRGNTPAELLLGEALYSERLRLKRSRSNLFTRARSRRDRALWGAIQAGLLRSPAELDRGRLLRTVAHHYADEIGGHFDPQVYRFATSAVPFAFSWLLNAASLRRFVPWRLHESVESKLRILGEVPALQKLAQKGTILLVPTHQSNIDSVLIGYLIYLMSLPPFAYGAGLNLFSNPVLSFFMSRLGAYTVDRKKNDLIYKQVLKNYSATILMHGMHSIFFPGGGRSRSGAIESRLKLGLLGTALDAQIEGMKAGRPRSSVFVVPMTTSYHFVLEAASLVEDYLLESGKHRFIITDDESWQPTKILKFFWRFFSSQSEVTVRIGKPLDIFGNFVDEEGRSLGPNGTIIDPARWLTTQGELRSEPQRDQEYTRELGTRLVERFHRENTVLTSHLVAFALFETLRTKYADLDLYRFLRLSLDQRSLYLPDFLSAAGAIHAHLLALADRGQVYLSAELKSMQARTDARIWVEDGITKLGVMHEASVVKVEEDVVWTEDMNLLYYYRNRLAGYGLSLLAQSGGRERGPGETDGKGFLA